MFPPCLWNGLLKKHIKVNQTSMVSLNLKLSVFLFVLISCLTSTIWGEDESAKEANDGPTQLVRRCSRRMRMMNMMNGQQQQQQPQPPVTEAALRDALANNVCASYNPNMFFPLLSLTNLRELTRCKTAAQYLMSSNIKRPDDCQTAFGVRCAQDAQGKMVCMIKTQMGFLNYDERPLSHCAQNYKPSETPKPPNPNDNGQTPSPNNNTPSPNNNTPSPNNNTPSPNNNTPSPNNNTPDRTPDRTPDGTPDRTTPDNTTPDQANSPFPIREGQNTRNVNAPTDGTDDDEPRFDSEPRGQNRAR